MSELSPQELVRRVRGRTLDCRTGVLLLPPELLGHEASLAARYNTDAVDFVQLKEKTLNPNARFIRLDKEALLTDLELLCQGRSHFGTGHTDCFFVYNFDLPLAALEGLERQAVWNFLLDKFRKRPKGLVFAVPGSAQRLLPSEQEQRIWQQGGRWAVLQTTGQATAPGVASINSAVDSEV
jgi:hypothetical protein